MCEVCGKGLREKYFFVRLSDTRLALDSDDIYFRKTESDCFHFQQICCSKVLMCFCKNDFSTQSYSLVWSVWDCVWLSWTELGFEGRVTNAAPGLKELTRSLKQSSKAVLKWIHWNRVHPHVHSRKRGSRNRGFREVHPDEIFNFLVDFLLQQIFWAFQCSLRFTSDKDVLRSVRILTGWGMVYSRDHQLLCFLIYIYSDILILDA